MTVVTTLQRSGVQGIDHIYPEDPVDQIPFNLTGGAPNFDIGSIGPGGDAVLVAWGYQITTTTVTVTILPIITIDVADYDDTAARIEHDAITIPNTSLAANAVVIHAFDPPVVVAAGRRIILEHQVVGTGAGAAGACRVWCVYRLTGN